MKPVLNRTRAGKWRCTGAVSSRVGATPAEAYCQWAASEVARKLRRSGLPNSVLGVVVVPTEFDGLVRAVGGGRWAHGSTPAKALHNLLTLV